RVRPDADLRSRGTVQADDRYGARLDPALLAPGGADQVHGVPRTVRAQCESQRLPLERYRLPVVAEGAEGLHPLLSRQLPRLLEALSEQRAGGLVVEDHVAGTTHEHPRRGDAREQV